MTIPNINMINSIDIRLSNTELQLINGGDYNAAMSYLHAVGEGAAAGAGAGAVDGAEAGSFLGPEGTTAGAAGGAVIGAIGGSLGGGAAWVYDNVF